LFPAGVLVNIYIISQNPPKCNREQPNNRNMKPQTYFRDELFGKRAAGADKNAKTAFRSGEAVIKEKKKKTQPETAPAVTGNQISCAS
jgi:hypothetical protein